MTSADTIIRALLENEEDEFDNWKETSLFTSSDDAELWMNTQMPRMGYTWQPIPGWVKRRGNREVSVSAAANPGYLLMTRYERGYTSNYHQAETLRLEAGAPVLRKLQEWGFL